MGPNRERSSGVGDGVTSGVTSGGGREIGFVGLIAFPTCPLGCGHRARAAPCYSVGNLRASMFSSLPRLRLRACVRRAPLALLEGASAEALRRVLALGAAEPRCAVRGAAVASPTAGGARHAASAGPGIANSAAAIPVGGTRKARRRAAAVSTIGYRRAGEAPQAVAARSAAARGAWCVTTAVAGAQLARGAVCRRVARRWHARTVTALTLNAG